MSMNEKKENKLQNFYLKNKSKKTYIDPIYRDIFTENSGVFELKYKDFIFKNDKVYIKNNNFKNNKGFVLFYAPWCSHCKKFSPEYSDLALNYVNLFPFGAINIEDTVNKNDILRGKSKVEYIPVLKYIEKDGELKDYKSKYDYEDLLYFININI